MYGNGANTWTLRNPGKTLLIQRCETVEKRCLKAMHKVNTSNSSRQVVSMALNTESTTQYLDYSYWLKACFFSLSLPGLCCHEFLCVWNSCSSPGKCWLVGSEVTRRLLRQRGCKRIKTMSSTHTLIYVPLFVNIKKSHWMVLSQFFWFTAGIYYKG